MANEREIELFINFIEGEIPAGDHDTYVNELKKRGKELYPYLRDRNATSLISSAFTWARTPCVSESWGSISDNWRKKLRNNNINNHVCGNYKPIW